ncbi:uncharacterized protein MKK02DRAFT_39600 [Dioszegia hungarica]|uniref:Uncharacterized protein n=1 Tax=Dioszegia hungarica TaxID=4972 RepID=A0AA38HDS4_9TREE|nr:uncharacterized protein MKK02DRAFT_39600 [Dioszegia hungarica]KAI9639302.1 hypothetical protein MKK02DRAFT_39600 [Dioszegia hungarica]
MSSFSRKPMATQAGVPGAPAFTPSYHHTPDCPDLQKVVQDSERAWAVVRKIKEEHERGPPEFWKGDPLVSCIGEVERIFYGRVLADRGVYCRLSQIARPECVITQQHDHGDEGKVIEGSVPSANSTDIFPIWTPRQKTNSAIYSTIYDDASASIHYAGRWYAGIIHPIPPVHGGTIHSTEAPGATATLSFHGSAVEVFGSSSGLDFGRYTVHLDGVQWLIQDGAPLKLRWDPLLFHASGLSESQHTLTITTHTDTTSRSSYLDIDRIVVNSTISPSEKAFVPTFDPFKTKPDASAPIQETLAFKIITPIGVFAFFALIVWVGRWWVKRHIQKIVAATKGKAEASSPSLADHGLPHQVDLGSASGTAELGGARHRIGFPQAAS